MSIKTLTDELDKAVTVAQGAAKALDAAKAAAAAALADKLLTADPGAYTITGVAADIKLTDIVMAAVPGVYVVTGAAARGNLDFDTYVGGGGAFVVIIND